MSDPRDRFDMDNLPIPGGNGHAPEVFDQVGALRVASDLLSRASFAQHAGLSFLGNRNLYEALGYDRELNASKFRDRYRRGDVAGRIVEAMPKATWRGGAELVEDEDPEVSTVFEEEWKALNDRLGVWSVLARADILAGLGAYSVILIGAEGRPSEELPRMSGQDAVLYLSPYGEDEAQVGAFVEDSENPRFGLPLSYHIKRVSARGRSNTSLTVHWTRVIHVVDNMLDDRVYGQSRLERVWNRLDDLDKVVGSGSEAFWQRVHRGMAMNLQQGIKHDAQAKKQIEDQVEEYIQGMRRFLTLRGIDIQELGGDVSNFDGQVRSLMSLISGATGIPQRLLLGSERGELASTQDQDNWNERVSDRRSEFAEPLVRDLVGRLIDHGALPEPEQYDVRWPDFGELKEGEKAEIADKWSKLNSQAGGTVVKPEEIRDRVLGLDPFEDEDTSPIPDETGGGVRIEEER